MEKIKVEVTMATSWSRAKKAALMTVGKKMVNEPDDKWEAMMLRCEHSPIRMVEYDIVIRNVPYYVQTHFVRHNVGCEKFVTTQRDDRTNNDIPRADKPQGAPVDMQFTCNAQALINISRKRLCGTASKETKKVWYMVVDAIRKIDPIMAEYMVPECVYRGFCPEIKSCGYCNSNGVFNAVVEVYRKNKHEQEHSS